MKKVIVFLAALLFTHSIYGAVVITAEGGANAELLVSYACTGNEVIRGLALIFSVEDAKLTDVYDVVITDPAFNAYIDYYFSYPDFLSGLPHESGLPGEGAHPVADPYAAGVLETMPVSYFSISLGVLDNSGNQGGVTGIGLLAAIFFGNFSDLDYCVTIKEDTLRGGIVGDNITSVILPTVPICVTIPEPGTAVLLGLGGLLIRKQKKIIR